MLKLVSSDTPVQCLPRIEEDTLSNPDVLTIEGFDANRVGTNFLETGNFHNGPNDEPAAFMILASITGRQPPRREGPAEQFQEEYKKYYNEVTRELGRRIQDKRERQKLQHLVGWLCEVETKGWVEGRFMGVTYPRVLITDDLDRFTQIFHVLRNNIVEDDQPHKEERLFEATDTLFQHILEPVVERPPLDQLYAEEIQEAEHRRQATEVALKKHLFELDDEGNEAGLNRRHLRTTVLQNGLQVTYADISGTGIRNGGPGYAVEAIKRHTMNLDYPSGRETDILMFVNDEYGADNQPNGRKKIMIKVPRARHGQIAVDVRELADRLNASEALFGGGKPLIEVAPFGGHEEVVLSPQFEGSELDPEKVFVALQGYVETQRFTQERFETRARVFAGRLARVTYTTASPEVPPNPYEVAQRTVYISVPGRAPIPFTEQELALYNNLLTGDPEKNTQIILQKTDSGEAPEVTRYKEEHAKVDILYYLEQQNAPKILEALKDLTPEYITQMHGDQLLEIFDCIASDPVAISQIYNKFDTRFGIEGENTAEWMRTNPEKYREMLHEYRSTVQSKVDWTINHTLAQYVGLSRDVKTQERYAFALSKILLSEPFRTSHTDIAYDNHLNSMLRFVANADNDRLLRKVVATELGVNYGPEMKTHWESIALEDNTALMDAIDAFPQEFEAVFKAIDIPANVTTIEGVPRSRVTEPTAEGIAASLQEQRERGVPQPVLTILVQISGRDVESGLQAKGIWLDTPGEKRQKTEFSKPDAKIRVARWLKQEGIDRSYEESEDPRVADEIIRLIKMVDELDPETDPNKKAQIRVIKDGFSLPLEEDYGRKIAYPSPRSGRADAIGDHIRFRLVHCTYMQGERVYCDRKYER